MADYDSIHRDIVEVYRTWLQSLKDPDEATFIKWVDIAWDFPPTVKFPGAIVIPADDHADQGSNVHEDVEYLDEIQLAVKQDSSPFPILWFRQQVRENFWKMATQSVPHAYELDVKQSPIMSGEHKRHGNLVVTGVRIKATCSESRVS